MKFQSLELMRISPLRLGAVSLVAAGLTAAGFNAAVGSSLGGAGPELELVVSALTAYIVATTPKRYVSGASVSQARESMVLAAAASACMVVTRSRSRTMMILRARERYLDEALTEAKRRILLGRGVEEAARVAIPRLASSSAARVVGSVASLQPDGMNEGGEEASGIDSASELSLETKLPVFMAACFFSPIMLLLYSLFSHITDPVELAGLVGFEVIVLDIAFFLCSAGRGDAG